MKVAIIGGAGFIGKALQRQLHAQSIPYGVFDKSAASANEFMDVTQNISSAQIWGCETLVVLAAEHRDDVQPVQAYYDVNVSGAEKICSAAALAGVNRIVFTSSVAVYGFCPHGADESTPHNPFNDYGRSKSLAEEVYKSWAEEDPHRSLVIIRPTAVFGEGNRGNVFNLLSQIASNTFVMVGSGKNKKALAYVKNLAAFLGFVLDSVEGVHVYNYVDKPDLEMNALVQVARSKILGKSGVGIRVPRWMGLVGGRLFDCISMLANKNLPISYIRVKKFCAPSHYHTKVSETGFVAPYTLMEALEHTIECEFRAVDG